MVLPNLVSLKEAIDYLRISTILSLHEKKNKNQVLILRKIRNRLHWRASFGAVAHIFHPHFKITQIIFVAIIMPKCTDALLVYHNKSRTFTAAWEWLLDPLDTASLDKIESKCTTNKPEEGDFVHHVSSNYLQVEELSERFTNWYAIQ